jgi:ferredoxin-thioredoxin reductase catalytic subunit
MNKKELIMVWEGDLELLCPCNFKIQDVWGREGRCWFGLFFLKDERNR